MIPTKLAVALCSWRNPPEKELSVPSDGGVFSCTTTAGNRPRRRPPASHLANDGPQYILLQARVAPRIHSSGGPFPKSSTIMGCGCGFRTGWTGVWPPNEVDVWRPGPSTFIVPLSLAVPRLPLPCETEPCIWTDDPAFRRARGHLRHCFGSRDIIAASSSR